MQKRDVYPDVIKGIAIILVLLGHSIQFGSGAEYLTEQMYFDNWLFKLIYSFHMPLFMLVSGYFFANTIKKYKTIEILKSKVQQLGVPILVWSMLPFAASVLKAMLTNSFGVNVILGYFEIAIQNLWFLWALLINSLIVLLVSKLCNNHVAVYLIIFVLLLIFPDYYNLAECKYMYPYFVIGYMWNQKKDYADKILAWMMNKKWICIVANTLIFGILLTFYERSSYIYTTGISVLVGNGMVQIMTDLYRWIIGFAGCTLVLFVTYLVVQRLGEQAKVVKLLGIIGVDSMGIYIVSDVINKYILGRVTAGVDFNYFLLACETIVILSGCLFITKIIKRFKVTRTLLLGSR